MLLHRSMEYGLIFGAFFVLKFGLMVLSTRYPILVGLTWILIFGTPVLLYWMIRKLRDQELGGSIAFKEAFNFGFFAIFFGSLIETLFQFGYFEFVDTSFIANQVVQVTQAMDTMTESAPNDLLSRLTDLYKNAEIPSPIQMAFQGLFNSVVTGTFLSWICALLLRKQAPNPPMH